MKFATWCPSWGDGPETARHIDAASAGEAAALWMQAENHYIVDEAMEPPVVHVCGPDGEVSRWTIETKHIATEVTDG